jgi:hypothetical protein
MLLIKRRGVMRHCDLCVRPGLGSKGLYWDLRSTEGAIGAETWRSHRKAALATSHAHFTAGDLGGLMVGEAFLKLVIRDPKVQAAGAWLYLERPVFLEVFTEGIFPKVRRVRHRRTNLPTRANVGYAKLKEHWGPLRHRTIQGSGYTFSERSPNVRKWDHKWPMNLDAAELTEIFSAEYDPNAQYQHDPTEGPIYHAAEALADRCSAFLDLIRAGQVVAIGTSTMTAGVISISGDQWTRSDKLLDIRSNDLFHKESGTCTIWWSGVQLRLPDAVGGKIAPAPQIESSLPLRIHRKPVADAVAACLKEAGLDRTPGDQSYDALANAIASCMRRRLKRPYKTALDMAALKKAVSRHFRKNRK